jgi:hypothetical protein
MAPCAACHRLFFELQHVVDPGPFTGQTGILPLQGQLDVRIGQCLLQSPHAPLELLFFVNLFRFFHADPFSAGAVAILVHPLLHGVIAQDAILSPDVLKGQILLFKLPHHRHLEGFAIPDSMILSHSFCHTS